MNSKLRVDLSPADNKIANEIHDLVARKKAIENSEYPQICEEIEKRIALLRGSKVPSKTSKIKVIDKTKGGKKAPTKKTAAPKKRINRTDAQVEKLVLKELSNSGEELSISALKARIGINHYRIEKILKAAKKMGMVKYSTSMFRGRKIKRWSIVPVLKNSKNLKASKVSAQA